MGPKRGTKRAAEAPAVEEPTSKKAGDATAKKLAEVLKRYGCSKCNYNSVMEALAHPVVDEIGLPEDCRRMLEATALHSICVPADERHPHQDLAVRQLAEVFLELRQRLESAVVAKEEELQALVSSQDEPKVRVQEAEASLESASAETNERRVALADATKALLTGKTKVNEKQAEKECSEAASLEAQAEKGSLRAVMETDFCALRDGAYEDGQAKGHFDTVAALVDRLQLDESLASALPSSLNKKPGERGEFDKMVVDQLESSLEARAHELDAIMAAAGPRTAECTEAMCQAQHELEGMTEIQRAAAEDLQAAQEKLSQATSDLQVARAAAADAVPHIKKVEGLRDEKRRALEDFKHQHLACFNMLKERVSARRQKELAVVAAAAAPLLETATPTKAANAGA